MRYYISDLHFFHGELNEHMDKRGFESVEAMNEYMIHKWNSKVKRKDDVVILGDLSTGKPLETMQIIRRLNGKKYMIEGNHDIYLHHRDFDVSLFKSIKNYGEMNDDGRKVILSHYPIMAYNRQYSYNKKDEPKTYMLYGHVHDTFDEVLINDFVLSTRERKRMLRYDDEPRNIPCQMINCFAMYSDYVPLSLDEWIELDNERRIRLKEKTCQ